MTFIVDLGVWKKQCEVVIGGSQSAWLMRVGRRHPWARAFVANERADGRTIHGPGYTGTWLRTDDASVMAHEGLHVVAFVLSDRGVSTGDDHEAWCYTLEAWMRQVLWLHDQRKRKKAR